MLDKYEENILSNYTNRNLAELLALFDDYFYLFKAATYKAGFYQQFLVFAFILLCCFWVIVQANKYLRKRLLSSRLFFLKKLNHKT